MTGKTYEMATGFNLRQAARVPAASSNVTSYDQSAWGILMRALVEGYGVDPKTFQLIYPSQAWNWPVQNAGFISAAQFDTLSSIPQWSAIGKYQSVGERFHQQYKAFLNVISPDTSDAVLRQRIDAAYNDVVDKSNQYIRAIQIAEDAFNGDQSKGDICFTAWLGTIKGRAYQSQIDSSGKAQFAAQAVYAAVVDESKTPNLTAALESFSNEAYYAKLDSSELSLPKVPSWGLSEAANVWKDRAQAGNVPGGSIAISNADSSFDYSRSWAGASTKVAGFFWAVEVDGKWERIDAFESDASLSASINFKGLELIGVSAGQWYSGVKALANGPYKRGFSKDGSSNTTAVFGDEGFLPMLKTGMWVAYQPTFTISVSQSTFSSFKDAFSVATGVRVGPFTFRASGGSEKAGWTASERGLVFEGTSTSEVPEIFGFNVQVLP